MAMEQLLRMLLTIPEVSALVRAVERGRAPPPSPGWVPSTAPRRRRPWPWRLDGPW